MRNNYYSLIAAGVLIAASSSAFAHEVNAFHFTESFTWQDHAAKGKTSYTYTNTDSALTATVTAYNEGTQVKLGGLQLDGLGVQSYPGNVSAIQRLETLRITFSQAVDVGTVHLRQWESADKIYLKVGKADGSSSILAYDGESDVWNTNEYVSNLGLTGITYLEITGDSTGTATFLAGLYNVTAASQTSEVPVPAAAWLFGSAMASLGVFGRRKKK